MTLGCRQKAPKASGIDMRQEATGRHIGTDGEVLLACDLVASFRAQVHYSEPVAFKRADIRTV